MSKGANDMKQFLVIAAAFVSLATTMPATAQNRLDDPNYGWPQSHWRRGYDAYARGDCRVIRERVVMPDGSVIYRSREICD